MKNHLLFDVYMVRVGFLCGSAGKESTCNAGDLGSIPGLGRERLPTPVLWPGEIHELYSSWGLEELDITEQLSLHSWSGHRRFSWTRRSGQRIGCPC